MLTANYHTHTTRCNHATGTEREYIENAIAAGLHTLGFSDHCPQLFPGDYYSSFRMRPEQVEDYVTTLLALREEYRGRIDIKIGYEVEYYPALFADFLAYVSRYPCDYIIMGQHFIENEVTGKYSGDSTSDPAHLRQYVDQVCEGMRTGKFTYFAHPDLVPFPGPDEIYRAEYGRLIRCAMEEGVPLEINCLGIRDHRFYPQQKFWSLAGELGASVVIGCDAHSPDVAADLPSAAIAEAMIREYGLHRVEPELRCISR